MGDDDDDYYCLLAVYLPQLPQSYKWHPTFPCQESENTRKNRLQPCDVRQPNANESNEYQYQSHTIRF